MADINKSDVKLLQSQRLDDSDEGGGQMTKYEVLGGEVNNLFPDISRMDRVYGRVSMRKAFLAVQTLARETFSGSHTILTRQAKDPYVSVCFFSTKDWFDTRLDARNRIESYLVKGPNTYMKLWGNHYKGSSLLRFITDVGWEVPEVGDVIVMISSLNNDAEQYLRVTDVTTEIRNFYNEFTKLVVDLEVGSRLEYDLVGDEVKKRHMSMASDDAISTVAADASRYYGVTNLSEEAVEQSLQFRVEDIKTPLVPSAASETAIVDAGVGTTMSPITQTRTDTFSVTRSILFDIKSHSSIYIGESILPGTFSWTGGAPLEDDGKGNIYSGSNIVGAVNYATGIIFLENPGVTVSGTGTATYTPACAPQQISSTGGIQIEVNNRGFVYTYNCNPLPQKGTLKVEYLASGKWYSIWDLGDGQLKNTIDDSIGSGVINFETGSVSLTLGAMPDVGSQILFFWTKPAEYYDFSGETLPIRYAFTTQTPGVARNTFVFTWVGDGNGPGPAGEYGIVDDGNGKLVVGSYSVPLTDWQPTATDVGWIKYATGEVDFGIHEIQFMPVANEIFTVSYNYGAPFTENFTAPPQMGNHIEINLTNTPIVPGTFRIEWHTDLETYDPETQFIANIDPTYIYQDDGNGKFEGDTDDGTSGWFQGNINYTTGEVNFAPHRTSTFPITKYEWVTTEWHHPGITQSYVFDRIEYLSAASLFAIDGTVMTSYCVTDGSNFDSYSGTIEPVYKIKEHSGLEIVPGGVSIQAGSQYLIDGTDGKLYTDMDGTTEDKIQVGTINYINKTFSITSDSIDLSEMEIISAVGTASLDPAMSMVFRTPGAPLRPGSVFVRGTTGTGTLIEGNSDFSGEIIGTGIYGHVDFQTGLCHVGFGAWVPDDAEAQAAEWYNETATDGAGNVWKPYSVRASTIIVSCVVITYLPLDPVLLGLDPVRLPIDGKVPIFRDGEVVVIFHTEEENVPNPLSANDPLTGDIVYTISRTDVDLIEVYQMPTALEIEEGTQVSPTLVPELRWDGGLSDWVPNYTVDNTAGTVTFHTGFVLPKDSEGTIKQLVASHRIEDMCLAADVQVTGHISVTQPLSHTYPAEQTQVASVLPSMDLQSRAYNEFEQSAWGNDWLDYREGAEPLASYNFIDYPIAVINKVSIKERWLILFKTSTTVQIIGENFGMLADDVNVDPAQASTSAGNFEYPIGSGNWYVGVRNRNFLTDDFPYYWLMDINGFGLGWQSGNCIRFNQDAANFPLWFIRTTLQAPPTEPVDYYKIQIRGDSS